MGKQPDFDAVVIGAGISGMYQVYKLREQGYNVRGIEAAPDVGGAWFWNRYPGCRVDSESHTYSYFWSPELLQKFNWTERFAGQPEVLSYLQTAAEHMDIRKDYIFNQRVRSARWDTENQYWVIQLEEGGSIPMTARFLFSAMGPLSAPQMPNVPGIYTFEGDWWHTGRWPRDPNSNKGANIDFSGKRVAVIGTGASGVQVIQEMAKVAKDLYVFQRSPNWCNPLGNAPLSQEEMDEIKAKYTELNNFCDTTLSGFPHKWMPENTLDVPADVREAKYEELYKGPGFRLWLGNYHDYLENPEANAIVTDFVTRKIRERVKDQAVADRLIPKDHGYGTRRVPMETKYYECYNQDNVHLVDLRETPIEQIEPKGIRTNDGHLYDVDVIVYATGFYAIRGSLSRVEIYGKDGRSLNQVWKEEGVSTYLGLTVDGFPNFFTLVGPQNGTVFCNIPRCSATAIDWNTNLMQFIKDNDIKVLEADPKAQDEWNELCMDLLSKGLIGKTNSWFTGVNKNVEGAQKREVLFYAGGNPEFKLLCKDIEADNWRGFLFDGVPADKIKEPA
ncbi:flavin-containing monooxygenase [Novosphingobium naphthalenivorans]|uniref:flavin-containing monooxygenase n=1 Tax=Novosphingobium naphthalenivorans TaxID=273168 RepID=UPI00082DA77A|nr:NAD(P)/FAD-dependent oxidoreductase [Novosphingobium naphthalenivorans]